VADKVTKDDLELLQNLGVDTTEEKTVERSPKEQRIIAGFEEIERFFEENGRVPQHGEQNDIFERIYAVRLDRLRESDEFCEVLKSFDSHGLLSMETPHQIEEELDDNQLLASLGVDESKSDDIRNLKHVRSAEEIKAAEEIAQREVCEDFEKFEPIFDKVQEEIKSGERETVKYKDNAEINLGDMFIVEGQKALVAEMGELFITDYGAPDRKLRVIYDNATENDLRLRSLQRALNRDDASRRILEPSLGPLFEGVEEDGDVESGHIYVLRSKSDHPFIKKHRDLVHKIGITGGKVQSRIANAKNEATYLLADVEVVATYKLANINRQKLEKLLHKFFNSVRLDLKLKDRFGHNVESREWFFVPFSIIEVAIQKVMDGTLADYYYDAENARISKDSQ